jgi:hypothetical protein
MVQNIEHLRAELQLQRLVKKEPRDGLQNPIGQPQIPAEYCAVTTRTLHGYLRRSVSMKVSGSNMDIL